MQWVWAAHDGHGGLDRRAQGFHTAGQASARRSHWDNTGTGDPSAESQLQAAGVCAGGPSPPPRASQANTKSDARLTEQEASEGGSQKWLSAYFEVGSLNAFVH